MSQSVWLYHKNLYISLRPARERRDPQMMDERSSLGFFYQHYK